jgi:hypothetical protein
MDELFDRIDWGGSSTTEANQNKGLHYVIQSKFRLKVVKEFLKITLPRTAAPAAAAPMAVAFVSAAPVQWLLLPWLLLS